MSTLVFKGVVTKIRTVEKYEKIFPVGAVASKVLKGELSETRIGFTHKHPGRCVIFREEFNTPRVGQEGTFFLQNQGGTLVLIGYIKIEQDGAHQPATAPESKPEGEEKLKPESEVRPR